MLLSASSKLFICLTSFKILKISFIFPMYFQKQDSKELDVLKEEIAKLQRKQLYVFFDFSRFRPF